MSSTAARAATLDHSLGDFVDGAPVLPGRRNVLRSVPAAGQAGDDGPDEPLRLGRRMRLRLLGAVQALLADPSLVGLKDAPRLAAVVLYAKSRAPRGEKNDLQTSIWGAELGRWMGVKESTVHHQVLPVLRDSNALHTKVVTDAKGHPTGLDCLVMPLWNAHHGGGAKHPLALTKAELATLLHLLEALFGPGWTPENKEPTPPGLLAGRTGRGAATDRLALLLMVLSTRASGWLQLCGGSVKTREGRGAATLARLLGCSPSGARKVLARLTEAAVVARQRRDTATRMNGRGRVMLLPVARAYRRIPAPVKAVQGASTVFSARPGGASGDHAPAGTAGVLGTSGIGSTEGVVEAGDRERPDGAELHTDHAGVVAPVPSPRLSCGFSGERRGGAGRRPERGCAREDQVGVGADSSAGFVSPVAEGGPLRGEQPKKSPAAEEVTPRTAAVGAVPPQAVGGGRAQQRGRRGLPSHADLRLVVGPVAGLWQRLTRWQQQRVEQAVAVEVKRIAQLLQWPEAAPQLLADRLAARLGETGGEALVRDPFGWLTGRGLVQRPACTDVRCDDGFRIDTGDACGNCANVLHIRQAWRARISAEVDAQLPGLGEGERRTAIEERLRERAALEAAYLVRRRAQAAAEQARRATARTQAQARAEGERAAVLTAEAARQALPCDGCGQEQAAGRCEACEYRRRIEALTVEAGLVAATWSAALDDPGDVAAVVGSVRKELAGDVAAARAEILEGMDPAEFTDDPAGVASVLAFNALHTTEKAAAAYRRRALAMLSRSQEAEAEARAAYATEQNRRWERTAEYLLAVRLEQLREQTVSRTGAVGPMPWAERLSELAARPLDSDSAGAGTA